MSDWFLSSNTAAIGLVGSVHRMKVVSAIFPGLSHVTIGYFKSRAFDFSAPSQQTFERTQETGPLTFNSHSSEPPSHPLLIILQLQFQNFKNGLAKIYWSCKSEALPFNKVTKKLRKIYFDYCCTGATSGWTWDFVSISKNRMNTLTYKSSILSGMANEAEMLKSRKTILCAKTGGMKLRKKMTALLGLVQGLRTSCNLQSV